MLASNQFDVVCLQEVWTKKDFDLIKEKVADVLAYSHYFYSGVTGSGICILSKHPIEETFFHQWSVNGYIHKFHHGDWWAGKGVGLCRLKVRDGTNNYYVNVYSTHLHAEYNRASDDYQAHRVLQAYDTAQFIMLTSGSADFTVLAGDLNTEPGDLAYRVLLTIPGFTDAYMQAGNLSQELYATCESYKNSFTPAHLIKEKILGKRIDYVMYHQGSKVEVDLKSYCLPLPERIPKQSYSYSDHEGILVELSIKRTTKSDNNCFDKAAKKEVLKEGIDICDESLKSIYKTKVLYWLGVFLLLVFLIISFIVPAVIQTDFFTSYPVVITLVRAILSLLLLFCFLMATMWSRIEMHGVLAGKLAMEVSLKTIKHCDCKNL